MSPYWCLLSFPRCRRLNHTETNYLILFGSLVFVLCLYFSRYNQLRLEVVDSISSTSDFRASKYAAEKIAVNDPAAFVPPATPARTTTTSTTTNRPTTTTAKENALPSSSTAAASSFKSFCSPAADGRGPHQKVIAYSIYGKNLSEPKFFDLYLKSFTGTLREIPVKYPGWVVRIYHELRSDDLERWSVLNKVLDLGPNVSCDHIDLCNTTQIIKYRKLGDLFEMTWRWLPMLDELVDTLMSRDSDSAIIQREQDAVAEWLASNKTFHIMRDHPQHCLFFVGGVWGVKVSQRRQEIVAIGEKMFTANHEHRKGYDQDLLIGYYRSLASQSMMAHDSYCCGAFESQPYPTPRQNGTFVGWQRFEMAALKQPCPENCRPKNVTGPFAQANWTLC